MSLSKVQAESIDLTATYAFSGTVSEVDAVRNLVLLQTLTASSSATLSFTSGIDNTYQSYVFKFIDIHPETNSASFTFNGSIDNGSNYNVVKTTTLFQAYHNEGDSNANLEYETGYDLAQSTGYQILFPAVGSDADQSCNGSLTLFDPSSTTFVKHFMASGSVYNASDYNYQTYTAGYFNNTSAIDAIQFKFSSGNIDSGTIKMYGVL